MSVLQKMDTRGVEDPGQESGVDSGSEVSVGVKTPTGDGTQSISMNGAAPLIYKLLPLSKLPGLTNEQVDKLKNIEFLIHFHSRYVKG